MDFIDHSYVSSTFSQFDAFLFSSDFCFLSSFLMGPFSWHCIYYSYKRVRTDTFCEPQRDLWRSIYIYIYIYIYRERERERERESQLSMAMAVFIVVMFTSHVLKNKVQKNFNNMLEISESFQKWVLTLN
jgi:hypothetical protein